MLITHMREVVPDALSGGAGTAVELQDLVAFYKQAATATGHLPIGHRPSGRHPAIGDPPTTRGPGPKV